MAILGPDGERVYKMQQIHSNLNPKQIADYVASELDKDPEKPGEVLAAEVGLSEHAKTFESWRVIYLDRKRKKAEKKAQTWWENERKDKRNLIL